MQQAESNWNRHHCSWISPSVNRLTLGLFINYYFACRSPCHLFAFLFPFSSLLFLFLSFSLNCNSFFLSHLGWSGSTHRHLLGQHARRSGKRG
ncbi:hypothetical protein ASPBRDRAFT_536174 [Aspergillus brasiliensis CBS 101740]|uniref:Uncharacterized protein n=1 Tax=Aspergillus brasiliensis (strain CBS 101740 / IMI 381727 / IBT 21946) TaxID=767769 RepID=A0A1L9UL00_ASPBC|nr:hypothetical protein ASPBRDRAFT_536174 [Aspergillus brasiliensis CBS 101740]